MSENIKILYVDDEKGNIDYFRSVFRKEYEILTAYSGDEAMEILIENQDIKVILTDQRMPKMTGVEFLKKSLSVSRECVRILVTGYADMETVVNAVNEGHIFYYIAKPWTFEEMRLVVNRAVETYNLRMLNRELKVNAERVEKERAIAELEKLRNQVNPHFLFNCLNTLHALVEDNEKARAFVKNLANTYRFLLDHNENETSILSEMEFVENFVFLQRVRFQNAVNFTHTITEEHKKFKVVNASLQMMVENILKHNLVTKENPIFIEIYIDGEDVVVKNNYQPKDASQYSTGIGQENLRKRLALVTDREPSFSQKDGNYEVRIPLLL
ncbi:MAG: histidine kinase [Cyclobacteriaceae bacterium]